MKIHYITGCHDNIVRVAVVDFGLSTTTRRVDQKMATITGELCRTETIVSNGCGHERPQKGYPSKARKTESEESLLKIDQVPFYLRFNPYIKRGYRRLLNTKQCCSSLLYVHNETVNVLTHAFAGIVFILWVPLTSPPTVYISPILYMLHYLGCILPFIGSTIYHLFMCHDTGSTTYAMLLKFDMCGIWAINAFGTITGIHAVLFCFPQLAHTTVIVYLVVASILLYFVLTAKSAKGRFLPLLPFGLIRLLFLVIRCAFVWQKQPGGDANGFHYFVLMELTALVGGIVNITRFPERYFPDTFDYVFNSHNIMHVLVTLSPFFLHKGTILDFNWMASSNCVSM